MYGLVIWQSVDANTKVNSGTKVYIQVSKKPADAGHPPDDGWYDNTGAERLLLCPHGRAASLNAVPGAASGWTAPRPWWATGCSAHWTPRAGAGWDAILPPAATGSSARAVANIDVMVFVAAQRQSRDRSLPHRQGHGHFRRRRMRHRGVREQMRSGPGRRAVRYLSPGGFHGGARQRRHRGGHRRAPPGGVRRHFGLHRELRRGQVQHIERPLAGAGGGGRAGQRKAGPRQTHHPPCGAIRRGRRHPHRRHPPALRPSTWR
jgi:hypothetical protein